MAFVKKRPWWKFWPVVCWKHWQIVPKNSVCRKCLRKYGRLVIERRTQHADGSITITLATKPPPPNGIVDL